MLNDGIVAIDADRILNKDPDHCYLTHYSCVRDLDRLADDLHPGLEAFVTMARQYADAPNRSERIRQALFDHRVEALAEHGFSGDRGTIWSILGLDVDLNTQGLEVWADRQ